MEKKYFQITFLCAVVFFLGLIACSMLLNWNVKTSTFINLKELGAACLYSWLIFFVMAVVFGITHFLKKRTWPI